MNPNGSLASRPTNRAIAEIFLRIGDLMEYSDESGFKVRSYWRAAETILGLEEPLGDVATRGEVESLPGVGPAIAGKIAEILATGTCDLYERLKREVAPNAQRLLVESGLTPRLVRVLERERGLHETEDVIRIAAEGLQDIPNLNAVDQGQILRAAFARVDAGDENE